MRQPNILKYLPYVFRDIKEMKAQASADEPELNLVWDRVENAFDDQFLYLMKETGIERWEKILEISPLGTDSIEDRRFRIISKLNVQLPYTYRMLDNYLKQMCGESGYEMDLDKERFLLTISLALGSKNQRTDIIKLIDEMVPCNIVTEITLMFNTYSQLKAKTHAQLHTRTHEDVRDEVL